MIGWFFLTAASIQSRSGPSAGFYGFLALVALAGPFVPYFWKDQRASLGGLLPLGASHDYNV